MLTAQRSRIRCREITGPAHSVALKARPPLSRDIDDIFVRRRKQEATRGEVLEFTKDQSSCDVRMRWERNTQRRVVSATVNRHLQDALDQYQMGIDEKRERLRELLESEELELFKEMEAKKETVLERQAKMHEGAKTLRERRESERQRVVADKLDQLFREQSEELRAVQIKRRQDQVCTERESQIRTKEEVRRVQEEEEKLFAQMWESDRLAKEERHNLELQRQRENNLQQKAVLQTQMDMAEQQRIQAKELKQEEAQLLKDQREMLRLEAEREHRQKLQDQEKRRKQLDLSLRLKMKRLTRDRQEELALDMSILEQLLAQEKDEKQDEVLKKLERQEEQRRYREYLTQQLEEQKRLEAETEQLFESELQQAWARREAQWRLEKTARDRLMKDVMDTLRLQIQEKLNENMQKQAEAFKEKEELDRIIQANKLLDEEEKAHFREATKEYQADLLAQMMYRQRIREAEEAEKEYEFQKGLMYEEQYNKKIQDILSRPISSTTAVHPFRRRDRRCSSSGGQMS
ncbi:cilia- and flagella-associated protein 53 [Danio rerio]|uniref:cilia- and flagella-associated protein 53 n=1 Tax=Danio rerio TaxID=7955 RepID=UPI0000E26942|nr:cilia- and flagella-associated protein 53 [Danio rerio]AAI24261.1 Si:ch211-257i19.2 [Danio rerio]|eukprot:NP_001038595.2 cilia- and flagella-associated protein 53 [Danio rerio]